jgi:hypothetical protein
MATPEFLKSDMNITRAVEVPESERRYEKIAQDASIRLVYSDYTSNPEKFENLTNTECLTRYNTDYITDRRSLIIVTEDGREPKYRVNNNGSPYVVLAAEPANLISEGLGGDGSQNEWACRNYSYTSGDIDGGVNWYKHIQYGSRYCPDVINAGTISGDAWKPANTTAAGCLSQLVDEQCGFYANIAIIWVVVSCNIVKAIVMAYLVFGKGVVSEPLMTLGDAMASYIAEPDEVMSGLCPTSIHLFRKQQKVRTNATMETPHQAPATAYLLTPSDAPITPSEFQKDGASSTHPPLWKPTSKTMRFVSAASGRRWVGTMTYFILCLVAIITLLVYALDYSLAYSQYASRAPLSKSFSALYKVGLGKINSDHLISGWSIEYLNSVQNQVVASVLIANTPQLALSFLYFAINTLITLMASSREWTRFSYSRANKYQPRTLRTSAPVGDQQRTYFRTYIHEPALGETSVFRSCSFPIHDHSNRCYSAAPLPLRCADDRTECTVALADFSKHISGSGKRVRH